MRERSMPTMQPTLHYPVVISTYTPRVWLLRLCVTVVLAVEIVTAHCPFAMQQHETPSTAKDFVDHSTYQHTMPYTPPYHQQGHHATAGAASVPVSSPPPPEKFHGYIPAGTNPDSILVQHNKEFRSVYKDTGGIMTPDPFVIVEGDYLVLLKDGQHTFTAFNKPAFHTLKMVSHIPLAVYLLLLPTVQDARDSPKKFNTFSHGENLRIVDYLSKINITQIHDEIVTTFEDTEQRRRQTVISEKSINFLHFSLGQLGLTYEALTTFLKFVVPYLDTNAREATYAFLHGLDDQMKNWLEPQLSADERESLRVIVTTSHMARPQNVVSQYFSRYFQVPVLDNSRFITLEGVWSEASAIGLLGTHQVDYGIGTDFFESTYRMHRDLLADVGHDILDDMFGPNDPDAPVCQDSLLDAEKIIWIAVGAAMAWGVTLVIGVFMCWKRKDADASMAIFTPARMGETPYNRLGGGDGADFRARESSLPAVSSPRAPSPSSPMIEHYSRHKTQTRYSVMEINSNTP
eukprot:GFYU01008481.1.p1 GENE.GFYU01008481.1~~GFYU01008481.1.p1  ORF type:complete len:517 (-),score=125.23 GFYU01008481.1:28-1578(-)